MFIKRKQLQLNVSIQPSLQMLEITIEKLILFSKR